MKVRADSPRLRGWALLSLLLCAAAGAAAVSLAVTGAVSAAVALGVVALVALRIAILLTRAGGPPIRR
ncbi:hypothetical protein [Streptacidiphilus monticola]|uniref:DUF3040 domain-containing protein n=1 Tax=Streptacidiphilus monticola TaxID=2161674 RepID=A0ABW1FVN3_9ACTN